MSNDRIFELLKKAEKPLGIVIGPVVVKKSGKGEAKVSYEGRPIMTLVFGKSGVERVTGLGTLRDIIQKHLVENGAGYDVEGNPNQSRVMLWDYEDPGKRVVYKKGSPAEVNALLLEAFCEYAGVL